jgi:hemolysin activation/secretion protein
MTFAAPVELPGAVQPGRDRPLPESLPPPSGYDFSIEAPHRSAIPRAVDEIHFKVTDIRVTGAVTLQAARLRPFYQDLIGKDATLSDVLDRADRIEQEYHRAGYILTRAYVPPQHVSDGIFTIVVVEGYVAAVSVEGGDARTQRRVKTYLRPVLSAKPLDVGTMEQSLLLINDLPGVSATGLLRPSPNTPGASDLVVTVAQARFEGGLAADNRGSHFSGIWTVTGDAAINSLFGDGDQLLATFASTPTSLERYAGQLVYRRPIGTDGMIASVNGVYTHGEPGSTLQAFDIKTNSWAVGARVSYPLIRTRAQTLLIEGGVSVQDAKVSFLGTPLSHDQWRVADFGVSYLRNDFLGGVISGNIDVAQGLPCCGNTPNHSLELSRAGGSTDFTKLTGELHLLKPLVGHFSFAATAQGQYSFEELIYGEQITFGGLQIGRGYEPGAITGDRGVGVSLELRFDERLNQSWLLWLQPYVFYDAAWTWFINPSVDLPDQEISSYGGGVRFRLPYNVNGDVEVARTLHAVVGSDNDKVTTKGLVNLSVRF